MREHYPDQPAAEVAARLNRSVQSVYARARSLGLKKSEEFLASPMSGRTDGIRGASTRFQSGQAGWNKGMKGLQLGGDSSRFKKGHRPTTWVPVGTEVMNTDGYLKVKVAEPNIWEFVHRRNWIQAHGPIPKGTALVFKDRDHRNCNVENLELISRQDLMRRNAIHRYPKNLRQTIRTAARLKRMLETDNEKQD